MPLWCWARNRAPPAAAFRGTPATAGNPERPARPLGWPQERAGCGARGPGFPEARMGGAGRADPTQTQPC